ncbi:MAG: HemK family protein methyltransferase, partial [Clostridia bacterium]|nr:HemK family protein methyltransferase [Clostridia bacterium]
MKRSELSLLLAQSGAAFPDAEARMCFDAWATSPLPPTPDPDSADVGIADADLLSLAKKRKEGMPIQYLLGRAWFYKECYEVSEACLIPRADTEHLVEYAIKYLPPNAYFADLCTGSGCVAISVLKSRADCKAIAVDLSKDALEVAKRNAKNLGVKNRLTFLEANALSYIPQTPFDAVLSN